MTCPKCGKPNSDATHRHWCCPPVTLEGSNPLLGLLHKHLGDAPFEIFNPNEKYEIVIRTEARNDDMLLELETFLSRMIGPIKIVWEKL